MNRRSIFSESDSTDRAMGRVPYPPQYFNTDGLGRFFKNSTPEEALAAVQSHWGDRNGYVSSSIEENAMGNKSIVVVVEQGTSTFDAPIVQGGIPVVYAVKDEPTT